MSLEFNIHKFKKHVADDLTINGGEIKAYSMYEKLKKLQEDSNKWQPNDSPKEQLMLAYPKIGTDVTKALKVSANRGIVMFLMLQLKDYAFLIEWKGNDS